MTLLFLGLTMSFLCPLLGFVHHRTHLTSTLICLESMMLSLFMSLTFWSSQFQTINFLSSPLMILAFAACGTTTGLALLVATVRMHGSDNIFNLNLLQC